MTHIPAQPSASTALRKADNIKTEVESSAKTKENIAAISSKPKVSNVAAVAPASDNAVDIDA
ncbi:hypothetical protein SZ25_00129 [Candidatus Arcanobacter lacustris]|uniref:Uncharacterized protein n=1 Tax=Candidatus Arcanibacter lacustris TaxID=1607817 RepID=A0A0F5MPT2_9RICK|nr:hypothetical protein SZ25_00129 [Candidatus Arcanobacter lacustris]